MSQIEAPDIWSKVDYSLVITPGPEAGSEGEDQSSQRLQRFWFVVLDVVAAAFWIYAVLKVFVANVDQAIFGDLAQYRFFFFGRL